MRSVVVARPPKTKTKSYGTQALRSTGDQAKPDSSWPAPVFRDDAWTKPNSWLEAAEVVATQAEQAGLDRRLPKSQGRGGLETRRRPIPPAATSLVGCARCPE